MRGFESEAFSGAMVEVVHGEGDILLGDGIEGHLLGEELADEAVHVFIGATLPGGVGMGKEEISIEFASNPLVLGERAAPRAMTSTSPSASSAVFAMNRARSTRSSRRAFSNITASNAAT